ncbi:MAG: hypothetical protein U0263_15740 [Polyangiaceae bacterium]
MASEAARSIFCQTLALLDSDLASPEERFACEEALAAFVAVLADDERCVADLLAYVARAVGRRRPQCRRAFIAAAALRAVPQRDRAFATACRVLQMAAAAGDDATVSYLVTFYLATYLRRCDIDPALLERGYLGSAGHSRVAYVASLVSCVTKDDLWLKSFVERELVSLVHHTRGFFAGDLATLRDFVQP